MIRKTLNRLWVRFSLAITGIIFVVTVIPTASLLLSDPRDIMQDSKTYIEAADAQNNLGLTPEQINGIAEIMVTLTQEQYFIDVQFVIWTTLIIGVLAGPLLGRGLSLPIERLVKATKAIGSRDLSHHVEVKGAQEIIDLANNFNQMTAELARSEQLRQNMMADVSHELLTPLTVLQGNLRAILDDVYELNKDEIATLYDQNKHLIRLVKDLRQLAQVEAGQLPFNIVQLSLNQLAQEVTTVFTHPATDKNITLHTQLTNNIPTIHADPDRLRQVLHNLLANALRHTPEGGQITIRTQNAANEVWLSITDTGAGIDPALQPHVFDRFYRTDDTRRRDTGGAGLGLAISKAIVEGHKGRLTATSPGKNLGTTFKIYLPEKNYKK
ncbi:MAG: HAMP domain-containing protein [Chloroflexi bacterium]|nr:MAG: HAMP domain-containing protein [Chloroflexota bacterium]